MKTRPIPEWMECSSLMLYSLHSCIKAQPHKNDSWKSNVLAYGGLDVESF